MPRVSRGTGALLRPRRAAAAGRRTSVPAPPRGGGSNRAVGPRLAMAVETAACRRAWTPPTVAEPSPAMTARAAATSLTVMRLPSPEPRSLRGSGASPPVSRRPSPVARRQPRGCTWVARSSRLAEAVTSRGLPPPSPLRPAATCTARRLGLCLPSAMPLAPWDQQPTLGPPAAPPRLPRPPPPSLRPPARALPTDSSLPCAARSRRPPAAMGPV